jgi:FlaA1/EpsC-like NDP-sugar epimerase
MSIRDTIEGYPQVSSTLACSVMQGKSICVTGAGGSIGSELALLAAVSGARRVLLVDRAEPALCAIESRVRRALGRIGCEVIAAPIDVRDYHDLWAEFCRYEPEIVFHTAALKHVPVAEKFPREAVKNNVFGTSYVAEAAVDTNVQNFVNISTDKVADPRGVMGQTKRIAETIVGNLAGASSTQMASVRLANVWRSSGSVVPMFEEQIRHGGPVTVTHPEVTRYFMSMGRAMEMIMLTAKHAPTQDVFCPSLASPVRIVDLAREMIGDRKTPIVYSGLRPGEVMDEILATDNEVKRSIAIGLSAFSFPMARPNEKRWDRAMHRLEKLVDDGGEDEIRIHLTSMVKECQDA